MSANRFDRYEASLQRLQKLLGKSPQSAKALAIRMSCSKPTIYARLRELRVRGIRIETVEFREGATGPKAVGYLVP
jgi:biotin operon repressor